MPLEGALTGSKWIHTRNNESGPPSQGAVSEAGLDGGATLSRINVTPQLGLARTAPRRSSLPVSQKTLLFSLQVDRISSVISVTLSWIPLIRKDTTNSQLRSSRRSAWT